MTSSWQLAALFWTASWRVYIAPGVLGMIINVRLKVSLKDGHLPITCVVTWSKWLNVPEWTWLIQMSHLYDWWALSRIIIFWNLFNSFTSSLSPVSFDLRQHFAGHLPFICVVIWTRKQLNVQDWTWLIWMPNDNLGSCELLLLYLKNAQ